VDIFGRFLIIKMTNYATKLTSDRGIKDKTLILRNIKQ